MILVATSPGGNSTCGRILDATSSSDGKKPRYLRRCGTSLSAARRQRYASDKWSRGKKKGKKHIQAEQSGNSSFASWMPSTSWWRRDGTDACAESNTDRGGCATGVHQGVLLPFSSWSVGFASSARSSGLPELELRSRQSDLADSSQVLWGKVPSRAALSHSRSSTASLLMATVREQGALLYPSRGTA